MSLQLTVLNWSIIVVYSKDFVASLCYFTYALSFVQGCLSYGCVRSFLSSLHIYKQMPSLYNFELHMFLLTSQQMHVLQNKDSDRGRDLIRTGV